MLSVVLVNREANNSQSVHITLQNTTLPDGKLACYQLSSLPATETFVSATQNALKQSEASINKGTISMTLPKLSVTVIQIPFQITLGVRDMEETKFRLYPNPAQGQVMLDASEISGTIDITINDISGRIVESFQIKSDPSTKIPINISSLTKGVYVVNVFHERNKYSQKLIIE